MATTSFALVGNSADSPRRAQCRDTVCCTPLIRANHKARDGLATGPTNGAALVAAAREGPQLSSGRTYGSYFFFPDAAFSSLTVTVAAVIRYSMVTLAPTFSSPVTFVLESRSSSHFSRPF
jgi:hypothetical protein